MPSSDINNVLPILAVIQNIDPASLLDVGIGFGKYGVLLREYLDVWHGRIRPEQWRVRLVGIDVYEGYRNPIWDYVYNDIRIGSAHELLPTLGEFDVILIADVIEHLDRPTARELVVAALSRSQILILSTPRHFAAQLEHAVEANTFEAHRILWTRDDFPADTHVVTINGPVCDVFVSSTNPMNPAIVPGKLYLDGRFSFDKVRFLCRKLVHSSKPL